jgi:hypothetical protein
LVQTPPRVYVYKAMSEDTFSFTFDLRSAQEAFRQVDTRRMILAVLATLAPEPGWEGCRIYTGATPEDPDRTGCIATSGPGAEELQRRLVESFERLGVTVLKLYEGGPEATDAIASVSKGKWVSSEA